MTGNSGVKWLKQRRSCRGMLHGDDDDHDDHDMLVGSFACIFNLYCRAGSGHYTSYVTHDGKLPYEHFCNGMYPLKLLW